MGSWSHISKRFSVSGPFFLISGFVIVSEIVFTVVLLRKFLHESYGSLQPWTVYIVRVHFVIFLTNMKEIAENEKKSRGGHLYRQVGWMPHTDPIPHIRSKGVKYCIFFKKPKAKIVPSTAIVFDSWRTRFLGIEFFTFNEKKSRHIPWFFEMSKCKITVES